MATFSLISNPLSHPFTFLSPPPSFRAPPFPITPALHSSSRCRKPTVTTRAGPTTSSFVFAFTLPLSLLAITVFTSIRIADKLDQKYLQEMAMNEANMEVDEDDRDDDDDVETYLQEEPAVPPARTRPDVGTYLQEEPAIPRSRNRPKREA
ncbi:hypothetical protein RIF29_10947 [Crotalaria pallida]|uniref:Uncharacterized protein n=1 Tax=Crotalaria pallida TaxID=3830 RepID=A0AAN9FTA8_CROPI